VLLLLKLFGFRRFLVLFVLRRALRMYLARRARRARYRAGRSFT